MPYLGNTPTTQSFISGTDYFNGTGSQTAFTLTRTVNSVNDIEAVVNNVVQRPNDAYTISGTTITFTSAPSSGTSNIYVRYLSTTMQSFTVPANSITRNQLDSNLQSVSVGRNRIINGAMVIDQRNAGASVASNNNTIFPVDRFSYFTNGSATGTMQQSSTVPTGFSTSMLYTITSGSASGSTTRAQLIQKIEGYNIADLGWGTANAKTVTLSFWVRSSLTGTFGGSIQNGNQDRSYPYTYTISSANTWEQKSVTIAGDTSGTWFTTNGSGMLVYWDMGCGSSLQGTAGAWTAGDFRGATGTTSVVATTGATWAFTGCQLEVGTQATSFEYRQYGTELALCQRYFEKSAAQGVAITLANQTSWIIPVFSTSIANSINYGNINFSVTKRASPTVSVYPYTTPTNLSRVSSDGGTDLADNSGVVNTFQDSGFSISNTTGGSLTTGSQCMFIANWYASAEL
jgi:hypothetical protein